MSLQINLKTLYMTICRIHKDQQSIVEKVSLLEMYVNEGIQKVVIMSDCQSSFKKCENGVNNAHNEATGLK